MKLRFPTLCMFLIALALFAPLVVAQDGLVGAASEAAENRDLLPNFLALKIADADFDSDQRPDGAVLLEEGQFEGQRAFRIHLHLTATRDRDLTFHSNESSLTIAALDVNRDGMPDLVVEQVFTHKRLQIWLNAGHGRFRPARVEDFPACSEGPCRWNAPLAEPGYLVLALPSRSEDHEAAHLSQVQRFNPCSPHGCTKSTNGQSENDALLARSPRGPPALVFI